MTTETLPAVAPAEPTTPIRPSEALRLGRLLRPVRCRGVWWRGELEACAVGAIVVGAGFGIGRAFDPGFAWLEAFRPGIHEELIDRHDKRGWSDDQIVAWLESLGL